MPELQFRSLDDVSLQEGLSQQRPATAYGLPELPDLRNLGVPLEPLPPNPPGVRKSEYELAIDRQERVRQQEWVRQQTLAAQAREEEITRREQAQRDEIRRRMTTGEPPEPRITSRNENWENPSRSTSPSRPTPATPAPTPNTSGAVLELQTVTATPAPALQRSSTPSNNPLVDAFPTSLPFAAGLSPRAQFGGVALSTAFRVVSGQSPQQALFGATGESLGTVAGAVAGSAFGPVGTFVGGMAGGFIGGRIADFIFDQTKPKPAALPKDIKTGQTPFTGGQSEVDYSVNFDFFSGTTGDTLVGNREARIKGSIGGLEARRVSSNGAGVYIKHWGFWDSPRYTEQREEIFVNYGLPEGEIARAKITSITRRDGQPDTGGDPPPLLIPQDKRLPNSTRHSGNQDFAPPSAIPGENRTTTPTPNNYAPGGNVTKDNPSPRGDSPDWVSHGGLKGTPHPVNMPQPLAAPLPTAAPARIATPQQALLPFAEPEDETANQSLPRNTNQPQSGSFSSPNSIELKFPSAAPVTTTVGGQPIPDANKPALIINPIGTGLQPTPTPENQAQIQEDLKKRVDELGLGLVALTGLIQGLQTPVNNIAQNTTPDNLKKAAKDGTCETVQPGGCLLPLANNAATAANNSAGNSNKLDAINAALNSADAVVGADTNARVRDIQADTQKIRESTGSDRYPMTLPEYLLDDFIDKPVLIPDQVAYNVWLLKQIDALVGLFPIKIERTDENGEKQMLKFENIAEAIAELTGLLAEIAFDADTSVNVGVHATAEAIGAKVAAIQATSYLKSIVDYLGFQGSHQQISVPISCTPGATGLDGKLQENELENFLKSSTQNAVGWQCTERDDLHSILKRILFDAEISRAALYKPLKPPQPGTPQAMTGDAIKADRTKEKRREDDEWEKFKTRIKNQEGTGIDIDLEEKSLTDGSAP